MWTRGRHLAALALAAAACIAGGCSGGSRDEDRVRGAVRMGGTVRGAAITVYSVDLATLGLFPLAATTAGDDGQFDVAVAAGPPYLIVASGGSFVDAATGATLALGTALPASLDAERGGVLEAFVPADGSPDGRRTAFVTPFSTIASRRVARLARGDPAAAGAARVFAVLVDLARELGIALPPTIAGAMAVDPVDFADPRNQAAIQAGPHGFGAELEVLLVGISNAAARAGVGPVALVEALARDLSDGHADGAQPGALDGTFEEVALGAGTLPTTGSSADLAAAAALFLDDPTRNRSGTTSATYTALTSALRSVDARPIGNAPPSLDPIAPVSVRVDAGAQLAVTITGITAGTSVEDATQTLSLGLASSDAALVSTPTATGSGASRSLSFTHSQTRTGVATIRVSLGDGSATLARTFAVTVTRELNDAPTFDAVADRVVLEDAGPRAITLTGVGAGFGPSGGLLDLGQTLAFTATSSDRSIIPDPIVSGSGTTRTVSFTPVQDAVGSVTITVVARDDGGTATGGVDASSRAFRITVASVNDPPAFAIGPSPAVFEDAGPQSIAGWATGIRAGPPDETGQTLAFTVDAGTSAGLFAAPPALTPAGTLTFTPAADANGVAVLKVTARDDGGTADGGIDTSAPQFFQVAIRPVNDPPGFALGAVPTVLEDSGARSIPAFVTSLRAGPADEVAQAVTLTVANDAPGLFSVQPAISASGTLTFTPAADTSGVAGVTVTADDDGGIANGGRSASAPATFAITILTVNDAPSFTKGPDQSILEDAGPQSVAGWASAIVKGSAEEVGQAVTFLATTSNPALFAAGPAVSSAGTLTYTPAPDANGTASVTVTAKDDGDVLNGGSDTSAPATFAIAIGAVNDPPSFVMGPDLVLRDTNPTTVTSWATAVSPGPADEAGQSVSFTLVASDPAFFAVQPALSSAGTLTFKPAPAANGVVAVTVTARDTGGTASGGSDTSAGQTFRITVIPTNHAPGFTKGPDQSVLEDAGPRTVSGWASAVDRGTPDEAGQAITFTATTSNPALFAAGPAVSPDGTLTYTPASDANGVALVTVTARDDGGTANGGSDTSAPATFTISVTPVNDAPGFVKGPDIVLDDTGPATFPSWATSIRTGPADEVGQALTFEVATDRPDLFAVQPAVTTAGALAFTSLRHANGVILVTVTARDDGGTANGGASASAPASFTVAIRAAALSAMATAGAGTRPEAVAAGDLNGDGRPDVVVANIASQNISVYLDTAAPGALAPSFTARVDIPTGIEPASVALGDLNGDGKLDVAVVHILPDSVSILLNTTAPGALAPAFGPRTDILSGYSTSIALGDVNGDGKPDLVVADRGQDTASVLLNTTPPGASTPTFAPAAGFAAGSEPFFVAVGDLDADGKPDIAVANRSADAVSVLRNTTAPGAAPSFAAKVDLPVGVHPESVAIGDLNGDGRPDLAVANAATGDVSVLFNTTAAGAAPPSFAPAVAFAAGSGAASVAIGDLNGDGLSDVAVANEGGGSLTILLGTTAPGAAMPSLSRRADFAAPGGPSALALADFNGDGHLDVAAALGGVDALGVLLSARSAYGRASPAFAERTDFATGAGPVALAAADVDGNGTLDLAAANEFGDSVAILLNRTAPGATAASFDAAVAFGTGRRPASVALGDLNGDGRPDIATANLDAGTVSILFNVTARGALAPSFTAKAELAAAPAPSAVAIGDLNGDGRPDLAVAIRDADRVTVFLNATPLGALAPSFTAAAQVATGQGPHSVAIGDLDGDGRPDLAVASFTSQSASILLNRTPPGALAPTFTARADFSTGSSLHVAIADVDLDGRRDVTAANFGSNSVALLRNRTPLGGSAPSFAARLDLLTGFSLSVSIADLDGNGMPDVAAANRDADTLTLLLGTARPGAATPTFAALAPAPATGAEPYFALIVDLNGDGRPDAAVANGGSNDVSVMLQR